MQNEDEYRFPQKNQILPKDHDFLTFSHRWNRWPPNFFTQMQTTQKKFRLLVIQHTLHISLFYISPFPKGAVARCFGCTMHLYSREILYVLSKNHFDRISHRFRLNVELSSPNLSTSYPRHFKDRFVKWPPGKPR